LAGNAGAAILTCTDGEDVTAGAFATADGGPGPGPPPGPAPVKSTPAEVDHTV